MTDEFELARLARRYSKEAIAALVLAIRGASDLRVKVTAALGLLDRGYGRPAQGRLPATEYTLSLEELDRMIADMERQLGAQSASQEPETAQTSRGEPCSSAGAASAGTSVAEGAPGASEGAVVLAAVGLNTRPGSS